MFDRRTAGKLMTRRNAHTPHCRTGSPISEISLFSSLALLDGLRATTSSKRASRRHVQARAPPWLQSVCAPARREPGPAHGSAAESNLRYPPYRASTRSGSASGIPSRYFPSRMRHFRFTCSCRLPKSGFDVRDRCFLNVLILAICAWMECMNVTDRKPTLNCI